MLPTQSMNLKKVLKKVMYACMSAAMIAVMAYFPGAIRKDWIVDQKAHDEQVVIGYQCSCGDIHEVENN